MCRGERGLGGGFEFVMEFLVGFVCFCMLWLGGLHWIPLL